MLLVTKHNTRPWRFGEARRRSVQTSATCTRLRGAGETSQVIAERRGLHGREGNRLVQGSLVQSGSGRHWLGWRWRWGCSGGRAQHRRALVRQVEEVSPVLE